MADALRRASEANINYFETVVLDELAEGLGVHPNQLKEALTGQEMDYAFALSSLWALPLVEEKFTASPELNYAKLGGSLASLSYSSMLVTKYYSLQAEVDEAGQVMGVKYEKALIELFEYVEKRAKENIALAKSVGCEPVTPVLYYEFAKGLREGSIDDKLRAVNYFWLASTEAQMLATLSGKVDAVKH
jgi:predicted S18 family serine protease